MNSSVKVAGIILCFGAIGLIIAGIVENFYDRGLYVTFVAYLGLSIQEFMGMIVIVFLLLGIVVGIIAS